MISITYESYPDNIEGEYTLRACSTHLSLPLGAWPVTFGWS
jgi:hypothetical protein